MGSQDGSCIYTSGNRCGHRTDAPVLAIPCPFPERGPLVLRRAQERLRKYYNAPANFIPMLNAVNGSERQQRSERREGCIRIFSAILQRTELTTMRVGTPRPEGFDPLTMAKLAEMAGLSMSRATRATLDLKHAGLIRVYELCEQDDLGRYRGHPAIRWVNPNAFALFGLRDMLDHEREKAAKRLRKLAHAADSTLSQMTQVNLLLAGQRGRRRARPRRDYGAPQNGRELAERKRELQLQAELLAAHPDWPPDDIRQRAAELARHH